MRLRFLPFLLIGLLTAAYASAQTGTYTQSLPNMQSVYSSTPVTFTGTPGNASDGTLSCSWLGCQDVGISNPYISIQIYLNNNWQQLTQQSAFSNCGFVSFNYIIPAATLNNAINSGSGSVMLRVVVVDFCPSGMGCSCCNDPYINNLTLSYAYSVASFSATPTSICPGQTVAFTNTTPGTLTSRKWYFNGGSPATATTNNPIVTYAAPGTYDVTLVTTSASGKDSTVIPGYITVNNTPAATVSPGGPTTFCQGSNVHLSANSGSGLSYQWQKNNVSIAGAVSSGYTASANGNYRVIVTNSYGCTTASVPVSVTVNLKPQAILAAGGPTTVCPGDSVVLNASQGSGYSYVWKKNTTTIAGATAAVYSAKASADYKVVVTNGFGCSKTSNIIPVVVNTPKATVTVLGSATVCNGNGVTLKANTGAGLSYQWKINNSSISGAIDSMYTAYTSGSYKVKVTNACGSATSTVKVVTIYPLPVVTATAAGATTFCSGGSVTINAGGDPLLTYQWKKNGVDIAGAVSSSYIAGNSGSYSVTGTNVNGCTSTSNPVVVTVNTTLANITANGPTTFCNGDSVVLNANTGANLTYQWTRNNITINGATSASYSAKTAGTYRVNVTNTASGCAKTSAAVQVVVNCRQSDPMFTGRLLLSAKPNPFNGSTELELFTPGNEPSLLDITTYDGKQILRQYIDAGNQKIILGDNFLSGIYLVNIRSSAESKCLRLIKY